MAATRLPDARPDYPRSSQEDAVCADLVEVAALFSAALWFAIGDRVAVAITVASPSLDAQSANG